MDLKLAVEEEKRSEIHLTNGMTGIMWELSKHQKVRDGKRNKLLNL